MDNFQTFCSSLPFIHPGMVAFVWLRRGGEPRPAFAEGPQPSFEGRAWYDGSQPRYGWPRGDDAPAGHSGCAAVDQDEWAEAAQPQRRRLLSSVVVDGQLKTAASAAAAEGNRRGFDRPNGGARPREDDVDMQQEEGDLITRWPRWPDNKMA